MDECRLCGADLTKVADIVWSDGPNRDPFCSQDCLDTAEAVRHSIPSRTDRAFERDHSLCAIDPCSNCA
jgi:hypothetical protein